jgi:exodeoxyribonuclease V beta subunit
VGDPKQCIYSFRGADLNNYLLIKNESHILKHNMDTNYRSSEELVDAVNNFYSELTDPFKNLDIPYYRVKSNKGSFFIEDEKQAKLKAFSIFYKKPENHEQLNDYLLNRVIFYLTKCRFSDGSTIKPSDIAVLFRTNSQIAKVREKLIENKIPAIEIKSSSIFESSEADLMLKSVRLLLNPTKENLIQFLSVQYLGFSPLDISGIDISEELQKIKEIKSSLDKNGIYYSLSKLIAFYHDENKMSAKYDLSYNRMKSNVLQLLDILHAKIVKEKISYELLLKFMVREINNSELDSKKENDSSSDHYEQKLESDENAVKLMTIHKSKGLEFPIVIFPVFRTLFNDDETRRVYYVALTRAKYKTDVLCFENGNKSHKYFYLILNEFKKEHKTYQNFDDYRFEEDFEMIEQSERLTQPEYPVPCIVDKSWKISSYSALSTHSDYLPKYSEKAQEDDYERFVFESMPRGKSAGIFLHSLFENADFSSEDFIDFLKTQNSNYLLKKGEKANLGDYALLLENVLGADYNGFNLVGLDNSKRINEFEYHIKIKDETKIKAITNILENGAELGEAKISGLLKGFIDMVFEKNGKFYIIDWKSNFLGDSLDAYDQESMQAAMKAANYDLQYHLYAVALCSFLKSRVKDFSYEKHFGGGFWVFLRGCRKGNHSGICHQLPSFEVHSKLFDILG